MRAGILGGDLLRSMKNDFNIAAERSFEQNVMLPDEIETKLDEADKAAAVSDVRYTEDEVFKRVRARIHG